MADAPSTPALSSTADTTPYVPISWMAVSAALAAGSFLVLLLFFGYSAAFKDHKPLIMPSLLILPVIGVVLSFAGRRMIRNSEGTRAGEKLANAAWWISVIGGLGYLAYLFAIEYSIRREAEAESEQWLGNILKDDKESLDRAFTQTVESDRRGNFTPAALIASVPPELYISFGQTDIVRLSKRNPGQGVCKFESGGLRDWMYRPGMIECVFAGLLKCPEGTFPLEIPLRAIDAKAEMQVVGRQWQIVPLPTYIARDRQSLTPYGWRIEELERAGTAFAHEFLSRSGGDPHAMLILYHLMIRDTPDLKFLETLRVTTPLGWALGGGMTAAIAHTKNYIASTKDYSDYLQSGVLKLPDGSEPSPEQKQQFLTLWNTVGVIPPGRRLPGNDKVDANPFLIVTDTAVEVRVPCEIPSLGNTGELSAARGKVVVACTEPAVIAELKRLRDEANPDQGSAMPPPDFMKRTFKWHVIRIESDLHDVKMTPASGPGRPPMPPPPSLPTG